MCNYDRSAARFHTGHSRCAASDWEPRASGACATFQLQQRAGSCIAPPPHPYLQTSKHAIFPEHASSAALSQLPQPSARELAECPVTRANGQRRGYASEESLVGFSLSVDWALAVSLGGTRHRMRIMPDLECLPLLRPICQLQSADVQQGLAFHRTFHQWWKGQIWQRPQVLRAPSTSLHQCWSPVQYTYHE